LFSADGKKGRITKGVATGNDKKKDGDKKADKKERPHRGFTLAIAEPNAAPVPRKLPPGSMGCRPTQIGLETHCGFAAE
jgi:hypothetical protein